MRRIDGKYHIEIGPAIHAKTCIFPQTECTCGAKPRPVIVNTASGQILPEDEPLILFRAKDKLLVPILGFYRNLCGMRSPAAHVNGISREIAKCEQFAFAHPERMKDPD